MNRKKLKEEIYQNSEQYEQLFSLMGALIDRACGNLNKLHEFISTLKIIKTYYPPKRYEIQHKTVSNGTDILVKDCQTNDEYGVEVKGSLTKKTTCYTTNWKFTFNELHVKKSEMIKEMYRKQNGGVLLLAFNGAKCIKHYLIGGAFLALYCTKKASVYGKSSINIGSKMCKKCKEYHRILKLQKYDNLLKKRIGCNEFQYNLNYFTPKEWREIFKSVESQCTNVKKKKQKRDIHIVHYK